MKPPWMIGMVGAIIGAIAAAFAVDHVIIDNSSSQEIVSDVLADRKRMEDLLVISESLDVYYSQYGAYPSTFGAVQTLCSFTEEDAGCVLGIKSDKYYYLSDGLYFILFSQRESNFYEKCIEHPEHLAEFSSLLC